MSDSISKSNHRKLCWQIIAVYYKNHT